jgi:uncharacterized protein with HEPN domain
MHIVCYGKRALANGGDVDLDTLQAASTIQDSVLHCFDQIGLAAALVSDELQSEHGEVPWAMLIRLHEYRLPPNDVVDVQAMHDWLKHCLPSAIAKIEEILALQDSL